MKLKPVAYLLAALAAAPLVAAPPLAAHGSAAPLTPSVRNEANAAAARARAWLHTRQEHGQWLEKGEDCTALALLAVATGAHDTALSNAVRQAVAHLSATNYATTTMEAWRWLALKQCAPEHASESTPVVAPQPLTQLELLVAREARRAGAGHLRFPEEPRRMTRDPVSRLLSTLSADAEAEPARQNELVARLAARWRSGAVRGWREDTAEPAWWLARGINRLAYGSLMETPTRPIPWRNDLAALWINRQRITPAGEGFWEREGQPSVTETAFAILLLQEL